MKSVVNITSLIHGAAGDSATASLVVIQPGNEPMDINALITVYFLVNSLGHIHAT